MKKTYFILATALALAAGCGDKSDPDSVELDKLSPPMKLQTITNSEQIELRWNGQNYEDDFKGYYVFAAEGRVFIDDSLTKPGYPKESVDKLQTDGTFPRCKDNNGFFEQFGLPSSDESCEKGIFSSDSASSPSNEFVNSEAPSLLTSFAEEETTKIMTARLKCYDPADPEKELGDANFSLIKGDQDYADGKGIQRCLIKTDRAGEALKNGTTYTFFVVAVTENMKDISWTSNIVEDTPAPATTFNLELTWESTTPKYTYLDITESEAGDFTVTQAASLTDCTDSICYVLGSDVAAENNLRIYIGRDSRNKGSSTVKETNGRLVVSVPNNADAHLIQMSRKGDLPKDPANNGDRFKVTAPGDQAYDTDDSYSAGNKWQILGPEVFDIRFKDSAGNYHYGKIFFDEPTYDDDSNVRSKATVSATVVIQKAPNLPHYFTSPVSLN